MSPGTLTTGGVGVLHGDAEDVGEDRRIEKGTLAVHVTGVVVMENVVPEGGAQSTFSVPSTVVGSVHVTTAPEEDVASTT